MPRQKPGRICLSAFEINRAVNLGSSLKFMSVMILLFREVFDKVNMFSVSYRNGTGCFSAEFMKMLIIKICAEFYFMEMIGFVRSIFCFIGYGTEPVIMTAVAFMEDFCTSG